MCLFQSHNKNTGNLRIDTCTMETDYYNGLLTGISIAAYNSSKEYLNKQGESLIDNIFFKRNSLEPTNNNNNINTYWFHHSC